MKQQLWFGLVLTFFSYCGSAATIQLGDTSIQLNISGHTGRYTYVHLHENESTSLTAALRVINQRPGKLIALAHGGTRNVHFSMKGARYGFDPNRIFTAYGLRRSLAAQSTSPITPEAIQAVSQLANAITSQLSGTIIALHNNTNDTMLKYVAGGAFAGNAANTAYSKQDPHNFFITTQKSIFETLKNQGFNVVLQNNLRVVDDGSLSVYAANHGLAYVNVEAAHGATAYQAKMLTALP